VKGSDAKLRIARSLEEAKAFATGSSAVTLGVFDGIHRGHRTIIEELIRAGKSPDIDSVFLITFDPHPVVVTQTREAPLILSTIEERLDLLGLFPLDGVYVVRFDETMQQTDYREFIQEYLLDGLHMRKLVLGYDCHFGKDREGGPESVQAEGRRQGFEVRVVPPLQIEGQVVSSTFIRSTLLDGDLELANRFLGNPYSVTGQVERGAGRGHSIGFPTANLRIDHPRKLWPPGGVYAVKVKLDNDVHKGMMNVGTAPTIKGDERTIEVHLFDFEKDIYGEDLIVYCHARLRGEKTFPSPGDLAAQLERDRQAALEILAREDYSR
jgi:riboflavin kinase/FMN adenylyltransferase